MMNAFERWVLFIVCIGVGAFLYISPQLPINGNIKRVFDHPKGRTQMDGTVNVTLTKIPTTVTEATDETTTSESSSKQPPNGTFLGTNDTIETDLGMKTYDELEEAIFRPLGYKLRENLPIPGVDYAEPLNCPQIFSEWLNGSKNQDESGTPPKVIPPELKDNYTFNGYVHLLEGYMDERSGTNGRTWNKEYIDSYVNNDVKAATQYSGEVWAIYYAMEDYKVQGAKGMAIGSLSPYLEGYALKAGAKHITTVEYTKINIVGDDRVDYKHPLDIANNSKHHIGAYDFIASFSSIEHSGLGRYGDALDPNGDLKEAKKVYCMLKDKGLFFIGLPMGWDTIYWNLHRIYGRIRFALIAAGFDILGVYYKDQERNVTVNLDEFKKPDGKHFGAHRQPLLVLRKR